MAAPTPADLEQAFAGGPDLTPTEGAPSERMHTGEVLDDEGNEEALDAAIDEAFSTDDPDVRREAFKNAMRLCMPGGY